MSEPTEPHERLDAAMEARRLDLRLSWAQLARDAAISPQALRSMRRGEYRPSRITARGLEAALGWERGSIDAVLAGGEAKLRRTPDESIESLRRSTQTLREARDRLRAQIKASVAEVVDEEDDLDQLERMRRVIDAFRDAG